MSGTDLDADRSGDSTDPTDSGPDPANSIDTSADGLIAWATDGADGKVTVEHRFDEPDPVVKVNGRRKRLPKWDRPPPPHDWRWWVGNLGKTLIAVGILMFGFVAYQLWGTGIENAAAQRALESDFEELLAEFDAAPADDTITVEVDDEPTDQADTADDATTDEDQAAEQNLPEFEDGSALAKLEIPRIGVSDIVVAGIDRNDLKRGPGHFPDTPLPGQLGNSAIAGHRTTYGAPFFDVDQLEPGDEIRVTTLNGAFVYRVTGQAIVSPSDYQVVGTTDPTTATLTLVSCHPRYTARERIIISAELDPTASSTVGEPVINYGRPDEPEAPVDTLPADAVDDDEPDETIDDETETASPDASDSTTGAATTLPDQDVDEPIAVELDEETVDVFSEGWFSDPGADLQVGLWGLALTAIAILSYLLSGRVRRDWVGLLVGIGPFVVALYFFFQNVNRLLPPNL